MVGTVGAALRNGAGQLAAAGVAAAGREARLLLEAATGLSREALWLEPGREVPLEGFWAMVARRAQREPLAYIVGWTEFWSLRFAVSPATLIPRSDSETLVEAALAARPEFAGSVIDLGTGTGCLLLAVLSERREAWGVGVDRAAAAARLAAENARALGLAGRAGFVAADWAAAIGARFDLVLSNPPYIQAGEIDGLMPEVGRFEPALALAGGADGLAAYRVLMAALPGLLRPGGLAVFELGMGQEAAVAGLAREAGFSRVRARPDGQGIARALLIEG